MSSSKSSRRSLLRYGIGAIAAGTSGSFSLFGAGARGREALVCIYLNGGNDGNSVAIPLDRTLDDYQRARGSLGLEYAALARVKPTTFPAEVGFHPSLAPLKDLFDARVLAVAANVGETLQAGGKPLAARNPLSHFDSSVKYLKTGRMTLGWAASLAHASTQSVYSEFPQTASLQASGVSLVVPGGSSDAQRAGIAQAAARSDSLRTAFPDNQLGRQLRQVARVLAGPELANPIFVVPMSGYDTHTNQATRQAALFEDLATAMSAFYSATVELGISQRVTTFTWSEFGRQIVPNSNGGTDHGWGSTHLVMGGSVLGGDVYGTFPSYIPGGTDDAAGSGVWIPGISRDRYFATLARWAGAGSGELSELLPGLQPFESPTLGFLG